jgi:hypothetical protein
MEAMELATATDIETLAKMWQDGRLEPAEKPDGGKPPPGEVSSFL